MNSTIQHRVKHSFLLQIFIYLFVLDTLFCLVLLWPGIQKWMFFASMANIGDTLTFLFAVLVVVFCLFRLFPCRYVFFIASLLLLTRPFIDAYIAITSMEVLDIFEFSIHVKQGKRFFFEVPRTAIWQGMVVSIQFLGCLLFLNFFYIKGAFRRGLRLKPLVFIRVPSYPVAILRLTSLLIGVFFATGFFSNVFLSRFVFYSTSGFMKLDQWQLYSMVTHYRHPQKKSYVTLIPMMHIALPSFYQRIKTEFSPQAVVLMEGVTDKKGLLKTRLDYDKFASDFNLTNQSTAFNLESMNIKMVSADVDVSAFSPKTLEEIERVFSIKNIFSYFLNDLIHPEDIHNYTNRLAREREDILVRRNEYLLGIFAQWREKNHFIVIPWGALHMRGIEKGLLAKGYVRNKERKYLVVDLKNIPWKNIFSSR